MTFQTRGRGAEPVHVLEDISLEVGEGEFICLVGPSGCGKSTLMNIVAGFEKADAGSVRIRGIEQKGPSPKGIVIGAPASADSSSDRRCSIASRPR